MKKTIFDYTEIIKVAESLGYVHIQHGNFNYKGQEIDLSATNPDELSILKTTRQQLLDKTNSLEENIKIKDERIIHLRNELSNYTSILEK